MNIDLTRVSFSRAGAYLAVNHMIKSIWTKRAEAVTDGLFIRTSREANGCYGVLMKLELDEASLASVCCTPSCLTAGDVSITFDDVHTLRLRGTTPLTLSLPAGQFDEFMTFSSDVAYINSFSCNCKLYISRLSGEVSYEEPGLRNKEKPKRIHLDGEWEIALTEFTWMRNPPAFSRTFCECVQDMQAEFDAYLAAIPPVPVRYAEAMRQAAYVNWSAQAGPDGLLEQRILLMSKNWMNRIWTWDCAFNAVELAAYDAQGAWANFVNPFLRQHETGMLLDAQCDRWLIDAYTKPPVHGWALHRLRAAGIVDEEKLRWIYPRLEKWVNSWYEYMDWDGDGMCQYNHGNDSGWDNCTYFKIGAPIEGPELASYLTLCHYELADIARVLQMPNKAEKHDRDAKEQLDRLIDTCWNGERFLVLQNGTHAEMQNCDSLIAFLPIILGEHLPKDIFNAMADGIAQENRFLTPYGLATESVSSKYYIPDGYWMGPVWAPSTMFVVDGLSRGGRSDLAREIARRFCDNCAVNGFAENFDAQTGAGLRDRAYTWTSSVFMTMVREQLSQGEELVALV